MNFFREHPLNPDGPGGLAADAVVMLRVLKWHPIRHWDHHSTLRG